MQDIQESVQNVQKVQNLNLPEIALKSRSVGATTIGAESDGNPFHSRSERREQLRKDIAKKNAELKQDVDEKGNPKKNHFVRKTEAKAAVLEMNKPKPVVEEKAQEKDAYENQQSTEPEEIAPKLNRHGRRAAKAIAAIQAKKAIESEKAKAKRELKRKQRQEKEATTIKE